MFGIFRPIYFNKLVDNLAKFVREKFIECQVDGV